MIGPLCVVTLCTLCFLGRPLGIEARFEGVEVIELGIYLHEERVKRGAVAVIPASVYINKIPIMVAPRDLAVRPGDDEVRYIRPVQKDFEAGAHYPAVALAGLKARECR